MPQVRHLASPYTTDQVRDYLARINYPGFRVSSTSTPTSSSGLTTNDLNAPPATSASASSTAPDATALASWSPSTPLPEPTLDTLTEIHWRHLCNIPFENTFSHYHKDALDQATSLAPDDLFRRIVTDKKGCFCFGQASLYRDMLRALGFKCYTGGGRVNTNKVPSSDSSVNPPPFTISSLTHMTIFVSIPDSDPSHKIAISDGSTDTATVTQPRDTIYLVDVQFGKQAPVRPIALLLNHPTQGATKNEENILLHLTPAVDHLTQGTEAKEIAQAVPKPVWALVHRQRSCPIDPTATIIQNEKDLQNEKNLDHPQQTSSDWTVLYTFTEEEMFPPDYEILCYAVAAKPHTLFSDHLMLSRHFLLPENGDEEVTMEEDNESTSKAEREFGRCTWFDWVGKRVGRDGDELEVLTLREGDHEGRKKVLKEWFGVDVELV